MEDHVSLAEDSAKSERIHWFLRHKEVFSGWRHVRKAARDNMEDVPAAFFLSTQKPAAIPVAIPSLHIPQMVLCSFAFRVGVGKRHFI